MSNSIVLYHKGCNDGLCAAVIAKRVIPDAEFVAVQYNEAPPDVTDKYVHILDFSYKRKVLEQMLEKAKHILILDHHKTAQADLEPLAKEDIYADKLHVVFDMEKSGARLAWDWYAVNTDWPVGEPEIPWLVQYVEDRDLWRFKLPNSEAVNAALRTYPMTFVHWEALLSSSVDVRDRLVVEGQTILRYNEQLVKLHTSRAVEVTLFGEKVLAVNATVLHSEIAGKLAENRPFGVVYFRRDDGKFQWSLRSREGGLDVSKLAEACGGGGHQHAAGYETCALPF